MKTVFYYCRHCGNVVVKTSDSGVNLECCGEFMEEIIPHTADMGLEKHVPVITHVDEHTLRVTVGSTEHPMLPEHHIEFICLETAHGFQVAYLKPDGKPVAEFCCKDKPVAVYEYCNLHGLWKADVK